MLYVVVFVMRSADEASVRAMEVQGQNYHQHQRHFCDCVVELYMGPPYCTKCHLFEPALDGLRGKVHGDD